MRGLSSIPLLSTTGVEADDGQLNIGDRGDVTLIQLEFAATGTAQVQGRVSPGASWVDLLTDPATENTIVAVATVPFIRLNATAGAGLIELFAR